MNHGMGVQTIRAVIYCRCSTEEESQQEALKKQVEEAKESVREKGWLLVDVYIEAKSGTTVEKRREYQRLYEDLRADTFDVVQIKSQDRLMRNTKDWYLFIDRLVTYGKRLYMYIEGKFYTPEDALITGIKAILAEEYSKELSKKMNNAHRNRQRRGESFILPPETYGYQKKPDKSIIIVEEEAKAIRSMFHLCKTMGCGRIASVLEEEGYRDRKGRSFQEEAIRRIIRNPIRCGMVVQNKRHFDFQRKQELKMPEEDWFVHKDAIPAIVSEELWKEANQAIDGRAAIYHKMDGASHKTAAICHKAESSANTGRGKFTLSGKLHCGFCGMNYYRTYRKDSKNHTKIEWKCQNYLRHGRTDRQRIQSGKQRTPRIDGKGCDNIHLDEEKLLEVLEEACKVFDQNCGINDTEIMDRTLLILKKALNKKEPLKKQKELKELIQKQEILGERLVDKLLGGILADTDYKRKKAELDERLQGLKDELELFQSPEVIHATEIRIQKIEEKLKKDILHRAILSEMVGTIEGIDVFADRLKLRVCVRGSKEEFMEILLSAEFTYATRKEAERERIIGYMKDNPTITAKKIADIEGISLTAANYRIKKLRQQGRVCFQGKGGCGKWLVLVH